MDASGLTLELDGAWADIKCDFPAIQIDPETMIYLDVDLKADEPIDLRICFLTPDPGQEQGEYWSLYKPGRSTAIVRGYNLTPLTESFSGQDVTRMFFGGVGKGSLRLALAIAKPDASEILFGAA